MHSLRCRPTPDVSQHGSPIIYPQFKPSARGRRMTSLRTFAKQFAALLGTPRVSTRTTIGHTDVKCKNNWTDRSTSISLSLIAVAVCLQRGAGTISLLSSIVILYQHGLFGSLRSRKWTSFINAASTNRHELEERHTQDEDESSESARRKKDCPRDCLARVTSVHNNLPLALKRNPSTSIILPGAYPLVQKHREKLNLVHHCPHNIRRTQWPCGPPPPANGRSCRDNERQERTTQHKNAEPRWLHWDGLRKQRERAVAQNNKFVA